MNTMRGLASRAPSRFLITVCIGVAATLAWLSYGSAARQMIANLHPLLGWLTPPTEPVAQSAPDMIALAAPAAPSFDQQQLNTMSLDLDAVRQSIDRIVASQEQMAHNVDQLTAAQQQMTREIIKLQVIEQQIRRKSSEPPPRTASTSAPRPVPRRSGRGPRAARRAIAEREALFLRTTVRRSA